MIRKFHRDLRSVKHDVKEMGDLAREMLKRSVQAMKDQDVDEAEWVISQKDRLADMDERIEERTLKLLTLYSPVAKDLRSIACIFKMITYLTRIGRYGKDIANVAIELSSKSHIAKLVSIPHMAELVDKMIVDVLVAFETKDLTGIENISERDDCIDALRYSIFRECLTYMMEDPKNIMRATHYAMVARYLERCADHACKMAEKTNYMVTGERVEIR